MTFKENTLVELCEIVSSKRVFAASYQSEGVPFFRGKEVSQLARGENTTAELYISNEVYNDVISRTGPINSGDILLTAVGTLGNPYQVKETDLPFYFKDGNIVWLRKFSKEINSTYLFYWLNSEYGRRKVLDTAIGSTQAALTITGLAAISISCPSLAQQTGIVGILSAIDQKITINNALSKTLEDIAQTIFKSWFIDFDPVKAKMAGEKPVGMDAATAALFPDTVEESELGLNPKGWRIGSLGDVTDLQGGYAFNSSSWTKSGVPVIKIGSIKPGYVDLTQVSYVDAALAEEIPDDYRIPAGSLVVGLTGYVGQVGLVRTHEPVPLVNQRVAKFKPKFGDWKIPFIYCFVRGVKFKRIVEELATGTAQQNVSNAQILSIPIIIPDKEILTMFENSLQPLFKQIINLADENESLKSIRDVLLPRLISGELQIPEEMLAS